MISSYHSLTNFLVDFIGARVKVVTDMTPWPPDKLLRVSVNSFGFGGANAHCILDHISTLIPNYLKYGFPRASGVTNGTQSKGMNMANRINRTNGTNGALGNPEEFETIKTSEANNEVKRNGVNGHHLDEEDDNIHIDAASFLGIKSDTKTRQLVLLPFSAHTEHSLKANIASIGNVIQHYSLADLAYTLSARRSKFSYRSFALVNSESPSEVLSAETMPWPVQPKTQSLAVGFVFTGQGAQWQGMGAQLFEYAVFRSSIAALDEILAKLSFAPSWKLYGKV